MRRIIAKVLGYWTKPLSRPDTAKYVDNVNMCDDIAKSVAEELGFKSGDKIIITAGFDAKHGITNTLRIIELK